FATLRGQRLQMGALEAAAKATLSPNDFEVFRAAIRMIDSVQTPRNHLAHWIWGTCKQIPDALLLAEPKAQKDRERELILALEQAGGQEIKEIIHLERYNPATVLVYRCDELERAKRDLEDAERITAALTVYLDRQVCRWASDTFEGQRVAALREVVFQHFYDKRLFREALDRIRANRAGRRLRSNKRTLRNRTDNQERKDLDLGRPLGLTDKSGVGGPLREGNKSEREQCRPPGTLLMVVGQRKRIPQV